MTYKELKDRLSKCEFALKTIKDGTHKNINSIDIQQTTEKLNILKESLIKQLNTLEEANSKTYLVTPKSGQTTAVSMSDDETDALKDADDVKAIKGIDGEEIKENVQFSVDETKAIAKKVGEAVAKSLKSLGDDVGSMKAKNIEPNSFEIYVQYKSGKDDEFSFLISKDKLVLQDFSFNKDLVSVGVKPSGEPIIQVDVLANELVKHFKSLSEVKEGEISEKLDFTHNDGGMSFADNENIVGRLSLDRVEDFGKALAKRHFPKDPKGRQQFFKDWMTAWRESGYDDSVNEGPHQTAYLKVPLKDAKKALAILDNELPREMMDIVDNDGAGNLLVYIVNTTDNLATLYDAVMDLQANDIEVVDHNADLDEDAEEDAKNDADYEAGWHDNPRQDESEGEKDMNEPDIDVGHVDDEPDMLQNTAYETTQYAAKLVKKLQKYNQHDGEVDFPNWWQSKLILAREYISSAYHYLDSKEKQPALDQLALENVDKVAGGIPYKREGNKFIISEPLDDATKERIISRAKEHGHHAAPNQAGGVTIMAKDKVNEGRGDMDMITQIIDDRADESGFEPREEAAEVIAAIADHYKLNLKMIQNYLDSDDPVNPVAEKNEGFNQVQAQYDDLTQVIKNIAHVGEMSIHDAAYNAVGHIEDEFGIDLTEPDQNIHEASIDKIQKGLDLVNKHIKTHLEMYKDAESPKNKQLAVNMLKKLNAQKKQLEKHLEDKVAGIGKDQELEIDEAGPGFKHDCAAKVVHEKYGKGNTIPEKHTLVKEGNKYVVTHYDVLFENGNTVLDIPVEDLKVETTNEHWHKGYKKKKK